MKKLLKFMGLLLVAGALFMGCQQNVDIDTDEITLSDGTWDTNLNCNASYSDQGFSIKIATDTDEQYKVADKIATLKSSKTTYSYSVTLPDEATDAMVTAIKEKMELTKDDGETVTVKGKTITVKSTETMSAEDIAQEKPFTATLKKEDYPEGTVFKANKKKTEYKITYSVAVTGQAYSSVNSVITFKKK